MRSILITIIALIFMIKHSSAQEISTSNTELIAEQFDKLQKGDLIITDVMGVLYYYSDKILSRHNKKTFSNKLGAIISKEDHRNEILLRSIIRKSGTIKAVDQKYIELLNKAYDRGVRILILTSGRTGSYGAIDRLEELRLSNLKKIGLKHGIGIQQRAFNLRNLPNLAEGMPSIYRDGVIFTHRNDKGHSLSAFMEIADLRARKIVFIDNQMKNIDRVGMVLNEKNIPYVGIHFTKIFEISSEKFDPEIADKQLRYLNQKKVWLTDEQAGCMIDHANDLQFCLNV